MSKKRQKKNRPQRRTSTKCVTVFRGTSVYEGRTQFKGMDGYVMSEAARDGYYDSIYGGASFKDARTSGLLCSEASLKVALANWDGPSGYSLAHSEFGTELRKDFGPRPAMSWTTELTVATYFAGSHGIVLAAIVPIKSILNPDWGSNAEHEVLLANGSPQDNVAPTS